MSMREVRCDAPGRINLIGEHTDYHQGFVLPMVTPQRTRVVLRTRNDRTVQVTSREAGGDPQYFAIGAESATHTWIDYVQGITYALRGIAADLPGFDLQIESDVPVGSGLSSSAALVVAVLRALREACHLTFDNVQLARIAQRVETEFVGAPVGIMDQMACSLGQAGEALFLDTRSLVVERIPLPATADLVVINSGVRHQHAGGEYAVRRRESFEAAECLGVKWLRDLDLTSLPRIEALPDVLARRARHIVTENARVHDTVQALSRGDLQRTGALFYASHKSMRDDYQISTIEIDTLVKLSEGDPDVYGARMTGGGFGGSVVMLVRAQMSNAVATRMVSEYRRRANREGTVLIP
jgi:galactokinase